MTARVMPRTQGDATVASSLVPADVWESWQAELSEPVSSQTPTDPHHMRAEPPAADTMPVSGLWATVPADYEVALFGLSQVPLFSGLPRAAIEALATEARQGELDDGDYLFREDTWARSFYVVLEGAVEILRTLGDREVALRHVERDEPVGLFGLFCGRKRTACARAIGEVILLEISSESLAAALTEHPALRDRMARFYRERLVEGFVGSSRLFADVDPIARARVIGRFAGRRLQSGEVLVQPGEVCNLVALVLDGTLHLEAPSRPGDRAQKWSLGTGDFLAVTCAFSGAPSSLRIVATEMTDVALLGHRELSELLRDLPALRTIATRLPSVSRAAARDVWCGDLAVPGL